MYSRGMRFLSAFLIIVIAIVIVTCTPSLSTLVNHSIIQGYRISGSFRKPLGLMDCWNEFFDRTVALPVTQPTVSKH